MSHYACDDRNVEAYTPTDTERLDWLAATMLRVSDVELWECADNTFGICISPSATAPARRFFGRTWRASIDAAMQADAD